MSKKQDEVVQLTKEEAIMIAESEIWKKWTPEQIVRVQLFQSRMCVPFDLFHKSMAIVFKRPVWTHEFAFHERLKAEYLGDKPLPTMQEILDLIPAEKRIVVQLITDDIEEGMKQ